MTNWKAAFGFYEEATLAKGVVRDRYLELKEIRKGDSYAIAQLNDAWKEFQRTNAYRTAA